MKRRPLRATESTSHAMAWARAHTKHLKSILEDNNEEFPRAGHTPLTNKQDKDENRLKSTSEVYLLALRTAHSQFIETKEEEQTDRRASEYVLDILHTFRGEASYFGEDGAAEEKNLRVASWYSEFDRADSLSKHDHQSGFEDSEIDLEFDRLITRQIETSGILRGAYTESEEALNKTIKDLETLSKFFLALQSTAESLGTKIGLVMQECLARAQEEAGGGATNPNNKQEYDRSEAIDIESGVPDPAHVTFLVTKAQLLADSVRLKVTDDSDIVVAQSIVSDSSQFFRDVRRLAVAKESSELDIVRQLKAAF